MRKLTWPYFFLMMDLRLWYTSAPARSASENVLQPVGRIMNSCAGKEALTHQDLSLETPFG